MKWSEIRIFIYLNQFSGSMKKVSAKDGVTTFVQSMLQSAADNREVKPQTRHDLVHQEDVDKIMTNLKKGIVRRN